MKTRKSWGSLKVEGKRSQGKCEPIGKSSYPTPNTFALKPPCINFRRKVIIARSYREILNSFPNVQERGG
jgi:hypothetical protein